MITASTAEWRGTKEYLEAQIEAYRKALEVQRDPILAAEDRGKVAAFRAFIAKVEPKEIRVNETPGYNL